MELDRPVLGCANREFSPAYQNAFNSGFCMGPIQSALIVGYMAYGYATFSFKGILDW